MKQITVLTYILVLSVCAVRAQHFNPSINKDSLLQSLLKDKPAENRDKLLQMYNAANEQGKEFLLFMMCMPTSSKKALIANIDSNDEKIKYLKTEYAKLVPANFTVLIEFNPEDKLNNTAESIDVKIEQIENHETKFFQDWNLAYGSDTLAKMIKRINWDRKTLARIKKLLADAHCVSIYNGPIATIGFARSGMGKYSYKIFDQDLTSEQIKEYNNGCTYIFYKRNIVLEYGGGAIGPQCFPD